MAILFPPVAIALFWLVNEYLLFRIMIGTVLWSALIISIYKLVKLILDDRDETKRRKGNRP